MSVTAGTIFDRTRTPLTGRVLEAEQRINRALEEPESTERAESLTADKGYVKAEG